MVERINDMLDIVSTNDYWSQGCSCINAPTVCARRCFADSSVEAAVLDLGLESGCHTSIRHWPMIGITKKLF